LPFGLRDTDIEINGKSITFGVYGNNEEYEIASLGLRGKVLISDCIKALRKYTYMQIGKQRPRVDLTVRLADAEKSFWEQTLFGVFVMDKGSHFNIEFTAHASVGMQENAIQDIASSCIQQTDFSLISVRHDNSEFPLLEGDGWHGWAINMRLRSTSLASFDQLLNIRSRISEEVFLPSEALTTPYLILRAIQSGRTEALIGRPETEGLEVKSTAYDLRSLDEPQWKLELAKDVTQFANAHAGGLLLIGYRTRRRNGLDIIHHQTPVQPKANRLQTYGDVLKSRVHPPISGLQIGGVPVGENEILYFYVPPQPEENKPYLISGAVIDDNYDKSGVTIVRRQGDACIPITAQEIHAALVIGRALMRGPKPMHTVTR
jgi:hypothetical protein